MQRKFIILRLGDGIPKIWHSNVLTEEGKTVSYFLVNDCYLAIEVQKIEGLLPTMWYMAYFIKYAP